MDSGPFACSGICACHFNYGKYLMQPGGRGRGRGKGQGARAEEAGRDHIIINAKSVAHSNK